MADFIPAGRLSAIDHGDQKIELQTEFSKYPEPRIATSVSIGGRVIHKIQKLWGKRIESIEEMRQVEEIINRQHNEVHALVREHAGTLLEQSHKAETAATPLDVVKQVEGIPTIQTAFIIDREGKVYARNKVSKEGELLATMIGSLTDVLFDIARITNLGDCEDCVLNLGTHDVLLLPYKGGYLAALVDSKVRKKEVLTEIWNIVRAA